MATKRPTPEALADRAPWLPTKWELADAAAIQAVARGEANPEQQRRAIAWVVEQCAGYYDVSFRPGPGGDRETAFAEGKRWVGAQVVKLTKVALSKLRGDNQGGEHG